MPDQLPAFSYVDLRPFLPAGWDQDLEQFATVSMFRTQADEGGPGSIGFKEAAAIDYETALRPEIVAAIPWTDYLHKEVVPTLLNLRGYGGLAGDPRAKGELTPLDASHGIVMNAFRRNRRGIEWHRDGADVFLNVILSTGIWEHSRGGRLMLHDGIKVRYVSLETPGIGAVVLTGDYPHTVEPMRALSAGSRRVTLLFSYTNPERAGWREAKYNDHFYAGRD